MCGIAGLLDPRASSGAEALAEAAARMAATLVHRGPDDGGVWTDAEAGVALGFRRLAVIDLSAAGRQPMASSCGRCVLAYNGELYNAAELRRELEALGRGFRGGCDSEVLVEAVAQWGLAATLPRLLGMFAFALWDRRARTLSLVRDRLGVKPLYWGRVGGLVLFGSELKALVAHGGWRPEIDRGALAAYMRQLCVPAPHSIYRGVAKLRPGEVVTVDAAGEATAALYWDLHAIARDTPRKPIGEAEALERLGDALDDAVRRRMVADVPLGAFLSGGIDSSLVVALMQAAGDRPVRTFTVGFAEAEFDEAPHAKAVAEHLGTEHTALTVSPADALEVVPALPQCYDEPFADSSQIPTMLLARLARRLGWLPGPLRRFGAAALRALPGGSHYAAYRRQRAAAILGAADDVALYRAVVSTIADPAALVPGAEEPGDVLWDGTVAAEIPDFMERAGYLDSATSLANQMLTKVDRASMAVGLEVRVPLLDHRVVELVWGLPPTLKFGAVHDNKRLLRRLLYARVPRILVDRPKQGFGVPVAAWLRGPLRDWGEALLDKRRLAEGGLLDAGAVRAMWDEHQVGAGDWQRMLWRVLMFEAWRDHQPAAGA